ncbi:MAG: hypothetical protein NW208_03405 [Bryobacter sp.]|nr:hypothetical protein [Bryobacter sp.]
MQRQPGVWAQMMFAFTLAPCVEFPLLEQSLGAALQLEEQGGAEEPALAVELVEDAILRGAYGKAEQEEPGEESLPGKAAAYWLLRLVAGAVS